MRIKPLNILLVMLAGLLNRRQQEMIDYLKEENKILREKLGKKRILLSADQKWRLAVLGRTLGKRLLSQICCAFSADTVLRWHRMLIANKYDSSGSARMGLPQITDELRNAIVTVARGNRDRGYGRIQGQLRTQHTSSET
jgi:hypothetical protein